MVNSHLLCPPEKAFTIQAYPLDNTLILATHRLQQMTQLTGAPVIKDMALGIRHALSMSR